MSDRGKKTTALLTCADLFAGAGGLTVGFHMAGFRNVFFNELDSQASETHSVNFPESVPFVCPIQDLTDLAVREKTGFRTDSLDVVIGGPPCQGFSINAPIRRNDDPRNHLFRHYLRLVLEGLRPKYLVLENVPGLVSMNGGRTLADVIKAFEDAGYRAIYKILNAAHYGVPQERWRLFILATRLASAELSFPSPAHYSLQRPNFTGGRTLTFNYAVGEPKIDLFGGRGLRKPITVSDAIDDLPQIPSGGGTQETEYLKPPSTEFQFTMREGSLVLRNHSGVSLAQVNLERLKHVAPGGSWRDIPFGMLPAGLQRARRSDHTKRYGRLHPESLSGTIMTKCDPHWGTVIHYNQDRIISVREAARLQSFPDWFTFTGSKVDQYRQVGNAVPPLLAFALAKHIVKLLREAGSASVPLDQETIYA